MDSKGQSLIAFIILLPVVFIMIAGIWEIGNIMVVQTKYEREIKDTIKYGLKHIDEENIKEKIETLLNNNLEGDKEITITENEIIIKIEYTYNNIYKRVIKNKRKVTVKYIGTIQNNKIIIEKEG